MSINRKEKNDAWMLNELISKGQFDYGVHPERYLKFRRTRHRRFPGYVPKPKKVKTNTGFYTTDTPAVRIGFEKIQYKQFTADELRAEISQIFCLAERRKEAERLRWKPPPEEFLKGGWKYFHVPRGFKLPITPPHVPLPLEVFSSYEKAVRHEFDAAKKAKPKPKFFSRAHYLKIRKNVRYWWAQFFPSYRKYTLVYFARVMDFNENDDMDLSRKNYIYPDPDKDGEPKLKISPLFDKCVYCMFAKILNMRKYAMECGHRYRYEITFMMNIYCFDRWRPSQIDLARRKFLKYDPNLTGFITFEDMCQLLDSLGDKSPLPLRKQEFNNFVTPGYESILTPANKIEFEEFLRVLYILRYKQDDKNELKLSISISKKHKNRYPWEKPRKYPDVRKMPYSFRKGWQYASIAAGSTLAENLACGMY